MVIDDGSGWFTMVYDAWICVLVMDHDAFYRLMMASDGLADHDGHYGAQSLVMIVDVGSVKQLHP